MAARPLAIPTVHLNGTSRTELLNQLIDAARALKKGQEALAQAAPNGRDYYRIDDPRIFTMAQKQHAERLAKVGEVINELEAIAVQIMG